MEFTPKKQSFTVVSTSAVRHNPYATATGGSKFMNKYRQQRNGSLSTPPREINRRFATRVNHMLSKSKNHSLPNQNPQKTTPTRSKVSPVLKRPFQESNRVADDDPYHIFSESEEDEKSKSSKISVNSLDQVKICASSDDDIFVKKGPKKTLVYGPSNLRSVRISPKPKVINVSPKPKIVRLSPKSNGVRSSPKSATVKVYCNKNKLGNGVKSRLVGDITPEKVLRTYGAKDNDVAEKENRPVACVPESSTINAMLPHLIGFPNYGNTCYLNSVLQSLLSLPTFVCDYKQITANLSLNRKSLSYGIGQVLSHRTKGWMSGVKLSLRSFKENLERIDDSFSGYKMQDANEFLTKVLDTVKDEIDIYSGKKVNCISNGSSGSNGFSSDEDVDENIFLSGAKGNSTVKQLNCVNDSAISRQDSGEVVTVSTDLESSTNVSDKDSVTNMKSNQDMESGQSTIDAMLNPVNNNFEFQLLECYKCLGCEEVQRKKQSYFSLYVNFPDHGGETIQDAIANYMDVDNRDLICEKCGHGTSSVNTSITSLPRIMIIPLKRYRFNSEQCESIKMSSEVKVNRWICLDDFMSKDAAGPLHWNPELGNVVPETSHPKALSVRNLSSELNKCEEAETGSQDQANTSGEVASGAMDEDQELQLALQRSIEEVGESQGQGQEEDEIQKAIRLSLLDMGMSYSKENQGEDHLEQVEEENTLTIEENKEGGRHTYCLISVVSHFGVTTNTGHYVSDIYNCNEDSWFHYDDECVEQISESIVFDKGRQKNGYIFFYMHKDLIHQLQNQEKR